MVTPADEVGGDGGEFVGGGDALPGGDVEGGDGEALRGLVAERDVVAVHGGVLSGQWLAGLRAEVSRGRWAAKMSQQGRWVVSAS